MVLFQSVSYRITIYFSPIASISDVLKFQWEISIWTIDLFSSQNTPNSLAVWLSLSDPMLLKDISSTWRVVLFLQRFEDKHSSFWLDLIPMDKQDIQSFVHNKHFYFNYFGLLPERYSADLLPRSFLLEINYS